MDDRWKEIAMLMLAGITDGRGWSGYLSMDQWDAVTDARQELEGK